MRSKKAALNTFSYSLFIIIDLFCAFILPRLILSNYGSAYNGLLASITQFLMCTDLLYIGIAGVTRAALYKPLSQNDQIAVNRIMSATIRFMRKVAIAYIVILTVFSAIYPLIVRGEYDYFFVCSLVLIVGLESFFQYFFATANRILFAADQCSYVTTFISVGTLILNTIVSIVLIKLEMPIHAVKAGTTLVQIINPVITYFYAKKKYHINVKVAPDNTAISQRWDACAHSIASFVWKNTDIVLITLFRNVKEVSVYSVYYLVINGVSKIGAALSSGIEAAFGSLLAEGNKEAAQKNFSAFESVIFTVAGMVYACCIALIVPFVKLYTSGINDVDYDCAAFGILASMGGYFGTLRYPYQGITQAAGKYKETKAGAITESVLNICISLPLVYKFGLVGVTVGTVASMTFRTIQYACFSYRNIIDFKMTLFAKRLTVSILNMAIIVSLMSLIDINIDSYAAFFAAACTAGIISLVVTGASLFVFWRRDARTIWNIVKRALKRKD